MQVLGCMWHHVYVGLQFIVTALQLYSHRLLLLLLFWSKVVTVVHTVVDFHEMCMHMMYVDPQRYA